MRFFGAASAVICVLGDRRCKRVFGIHGGLTPPAPGWRCECLPAIFAKTIFAMERTCPRAAGVSPPWIANAGAIADVFHGRLTPTAPGATDERQRVKPANRVWRHRQCTNARGRTHKSGGREPAVVCGIRPLSSEYPILFNEHRTGNREPRPSARRGVWDTTGEHPILFSARQTENREWRALFNERTAMLAEITPAALLRREGGTQFNERTAMLAEIMGRICTDRLQVGGLGPVERPL
jgi:hypothetical protein